MPSARLTKARRTASERLNHCYSPEITHKLWGRTNKLLPVKLFITTCAGVVLSTILSSCCARHRKQDVFVVENYPEYNQRSIVDAWGVPAEILLRRHVHKNGDNVVIWVYYLQGESGGIAPVLYFFRDGMLISTNAFGKEKLRVMDVNDVSDLKLILSEREWIKKCWPVWTDS